MSNSLPQEDSREASELQDTGEQRVEKLASILDRYALTHLEFEDSNTHIVLRREAASSAAFVSPAALPATGQALTQGTGCEDSAGSAASASTQGGVQPGASPAMQQQAASGNTTSSWQRATQDSPLNSPEPSKLVMAPLVGLAYRSKEPGAEPFVQVGDAVEEGAVLCLIEAMKMFNEVKAPCSGVICAISFVDGDLVEFGAPLFSLD